MRTSVLVGLGLGAAAAVTLSVVALAPPPEAPPAAPPEAPPEAPPAPAASRYALGINEAIAVPVTIRDRGRIPPERLEAMLLDDARLARDVGATWVRGHTGNFPRLGWSSVRDRPELLAGEGDAWVRALQSQGLEGLGMISPWPGNQTANATERYVPDDLAAYEAHVRRVVERYDGDGVDDMPGLTRPVRYWEVDNEPDLKFTNVPRDPVRPMKPETFCFPEEYAQVLIATSRAIKAANPEAVVLNGGPYRPHAPSSRAYLEQVFAVPGARAAVDVVSVHTYHDALDGERLAAGIATLRELVPGKPVWVTETSVGLSETIDEEAQARAVVALAGVSAVAGAERLFWHTLADPPPAPPNANRKPGAFSTNSLFRTETGDVRVDKPAATVFRHLAAVLAADDLTGATADGRGAARLRSGAVLLWDGERAAPRGGVDLRTGAAIPEGATARSPAYLR